MFLKNLGGGRGKELTVEILSVLHGTAIVGCGIDLDQGTGTAPAIGDALQ